MREWAASPGTLPAAASFLLSRAAGIETFALARAHAGPGRLLDVGSGRGEILDSFARLGWETVGIEPGRAVAEAVRARGHDVLAEDFASAPIELEFDLVVFSHSLEHMRDPRAALEKARGLLAPGGRIFVATPNAGGALSRIFGENWWQLDAPRHLVVLSRSGLRSIAARAGLRVLRMHTHSVPMGPLVSRRLARENAYLIERWDIRHEHRATSALARTGSLLADLAGVGDNLHAVLEVPR